MALYPLHSIGLTGLDTVELWRVTGTWYCFWYHIHQGTKQAEAMPKGDKHRPPINQRIIIITATLLWERGIMKKPATFKQHNVYL